MPADRMRASDAEREQTVGFLRDAVGEGRLDMDEFTERTTQAYLAKTRGELLVLLDDIPAAQLAAPPPPAPSPDRGLPRIPGRFGFSARWVAPTDRRRAATDLEEFVAPLMRTHGYALVHGGEALKVFARERRPLWTYVVAVVFFPIGLLALLHKERAQIVFELRERGEETLISVSGDAPLAIRRGLSALER
ncbi:DUF1707 domain-containing protein [Solirubrobacter phytolaccae]|uniref:DUF1707 domain-containing protein n=1 Tax=Solirubrobacter phytolaccae TaxID=1404360 RepID=A0A9X3N6R5_9ACTN|nr:DUF1707 domain-containing protein [Solirubrobacter phytolaccae]MDA0179490.1 DUF1707 domain-containing protein [Solirubrobacter phytolaccae]